MPRLSSITIGLFVLLVAIVGTGIYLVSRPRSSTEAASLRPESYQLPVPSARDPPSVSFNPGAAPPHPPTASIARILVERSTSSGKTAVPVGFPDASIAIDGQPDRGDGKNDTESSPRNRGLLIALNNQKRRETADERVFEVQRISEGTRVVIRQINETYKDQVRASWNADSGRFTVGTTSTTVLPHSNDAERVRRDAIDNLLGSEAGRDFSAAERVAIQQFRGKYRLEQARILRP